VRIQGCEQVEKLLITLVNGRDLTVNLDIMEEIQLPSTNNSDLFMMGNDGGFGFIPVGQILLIHGCIGDQCRGSH
jgi:hypothetical protein